MNSVNIIGNAGTDPELRYTTGPESKAVVEIDLAVHTHTNKGETTDWITCVFWSRAAETIAKRLRKGDRLAVSGRLVERKWNTEAGQIRRAHKVYAQDFDFLTPKPADDPAAADSPDEARV